MGKGSVGLENLVAMDDQPEEMKMTAILHRTPSFSLPSMVMSIWRMTKEKEEAW